MSVSRHDFHYFPPHFRENDTLTLTDASCTCARARALFGEEINKQKRAGKRECKKKERKRQSWQAAPQGENSYGSRAASSVRVRRHEHEQEKRTRPPLAAHSGMNEETNLTLKGRQRGGERPMLTRRAEVSSSQHRHAQKNIYNRCSTTGQCSRRPENTAENTASTRTAPPHFAGDAYSK